MKKFIFLLLLSLFIVPKNVSAQTLNPVSWQTGATGLKANSKTAGLYFIIDKNGPSLSSQGGISTSTRRCIKGVGGYLDYIYSGINLGQIQTGQTLGTYSESVDWSGNTMSYGTALKIYISRLTPAILVSASSTTVKLFAGTPAMKTYLSGDKKWALVWYGSSSTITDTKMPVGQECALTSANAYKGDVPMLITFQDINLPTSISGTGGGVTLNFSQSPTFSITPLYGRNIQVASTTEGWGTSPPPAVTQKASNLASYSCDFPQKVSETYSSTQDSATITESLTYVSFCAGTKLAPLPSFLSLSKNALGNFLNISGTTVDLLIPTEFGPFMGVTNPTNNSYTWTVSGISKYIDSTRNIGNGSVPAELDTELTAQANKIISSGHYAPWIFMDDVPRWTGRGDLYFANPADILYHLSEIIPAVSNSSVKSNLINYLKSERAAYPPEDQFDLDLITGKQRQSYTYYGDQGSWDYYWKYDPACSDCQNDSHYPKVPLYNYYGLSKYYEITNESVPATSLTKLKITLDTTMKEHDFATGYWFSGFDSPFYNEPYAVAITNRHLAGTIGSARIAKRGSDAAIEQLSRALTVRALVTKLGLTLYNSYIYSNGIVQTPSDPSWQPKATASEWAGSLFNYNWNGPLRDARQALSLNQFGIQLREDNGAYSVENGTGIGTGHLTGYIGLIPETGRMLRDFAKTDALTYANVATDFMPHWYGAFSEAVLGSEHNMFHPLDAFQIFSAKAYIENDTSMNLAHYSDISWLDDGDLFYVQKLAEAIKSYKGVSWSDGGVAPTSPPQNPYDLNHDGKINTSDLTLVLSNFETTTSTNDVTNDGKINSLEAVGILLNWNP